MTIAAAAHQFDDRTSVRPTHPATASSAGDGSKPGRGRAYLSIGQVLASLRAEFPEVTISKIRFLESEGLVEPDRSPSGYRKFSREDVGRLSYVLASQRDHYLPLRVIKDNLAALDRGLEPAAVADGGARVPRTLTAAEGLPRPDDFAPEVSELRLSRSELLQAADLGDEQLDTLEQYGMLAPRGGGHYDATALIVAKAAAALAQFGIEPRHLRSFKTAADREIGLVEQVVSPLLGQRTADARARAESTAQQIAALSIALHAALVKNGLGPALTR